MYGDIWRIGKRKIRGLVLIIFYCIYEMNLWRIKLKLMLVKLKNLKRLLYLYIKGWKEM